MMQSPLLNIKQGFESWKQYVLHYVQMLQIVLSDIDWKGFSFEMCIALCILTCSTIESDIAKSFKRNDKNISDMWQ